MDIFYCTPFSLEKNLGKAYNDYVKRIAQRDDDWVFFIDGDSMFLDPFWGKHISDIVNKYPNTGLFTCKTSRVGCLLQCHNFVRSQETDMIKHFWISEELKQKKYWDVSKVKHIISGVMMGFSFKTWKEVGGFSENPKEILRVDNRFSSRILNSGKNILMMEGVYLLHYYRMHQPNAKRAKAHLL